MEQKEYKLSPKQIAFCDAYLANGFNGTQAAITAGYSPKTANEQASRLLANVNIQKYIKSKQEPLAEKFKVTREYLVEKLNNVILDDVKDSVYIKAIEVLAKMTGLNEPEKIELKTTMSPIKFNIKFKNDGS